MSDKERVVKMARPDVEEQEAVRTTIVGGRPPGPGQAVGDVPRGVEVLIKKAAVDAAFRDVLLDERDGAAEKIGLALEPAEAAMLRSIPAAQLAAVVARTRVSPNLNAAFMTYTAAVMLAALGATTAAAADEHYVTKGIDPNMPMAGVDAETAGTASAGVVVPADAGVFAGTVVGPQGEPLAGARLEVAGQNDVTATTAEDGTFTLGPVAPGVYTIICMADGMRMAFHENVKAIAGYATAVNFALAWGEEPCGGARPDEP